MDYPLSLKPQINPFFTNISKTTSTTSPYFNIHYSRAQKQAASINSSTNRLIIRSSNNIVTLASSNITSSPANNNDRGIAAAARAVGGSLAMAFAVGAFCCGFALISPGKAAAIWTRKTTTTTTSSRSSSGQYPEEQETNPAAMRSTSPTTDALRTFLEMMVYLASPAATSLPTPRIALNEDVAKLKLEALVQIKKGKKINVALEQLEKKRAMFPRKGYADEKYFVEMALVEILISQGYYIKALQYRDFLEGKTNPSDFRPALYKAIIYTMLGSDKKYPSPEKCWIDFFQAGEESLPNPGGINSDS